MLEREIFTIGYEGCHIEQTMDTLNKASIQMLIDVRAVPISRKKGYSKNSLKENLDFRGIKYRHLKDLGNSKEGRQAAWRQDPRWKDIFRKCLEKEPAQDQLDEVVDLMSKYKACLLCFEQDYRDCHRYLVVEAIQKRTSYNLHVRHL